MFIGLLSTCSTAGLGEPITTISNEIIKWIDHVKLDQHSLI